MESTDSEAALEAPQAAPYKSNVVAAVWALVFPPAGLWYKRRYAAGCAWLVAATAVYAIVPGGVPFVAAMAFGMFGPVLHAFVATPAAPRRPPVRGR